jgi:hypothetical protein
MRVISWIGIAVVAITPLMSAQNTDPGAAGLDSARVAIQAGDYEGRISAHACRYAGVNRTTEDHAANF